MRPTLFGLHHVTAITADVKKNYMFYAKILGLRLVKKTVNQDDTKAYHLFYADGVGSPGSDITFFDWPYSAGAKRPRHSFGAVLRTGLCLANEEAFDYWQKRFEDFQIAYRVIAEEGKTHRLDFEDFEGQKLSLSVNEAIKPNLWQDSAVPEKFQISGLGPIVLGSAKFQETRTFLINILGLTHHAQYQDQALSPHAIEVFFFEHDSNRNFIHLVNIDESNQQMIDNAGAGSVHHVAFRVPDELVLQAWDTFTQSHHIKTSGEIDRFYFQSLYFREPSGILFEIATDGPGFHQDEPLETMGQSLSLPPFLEPKRAAIEAQLTPLEF